MQISLTIETLQFKKAILLWSWFYGKQCI